MYNLTKKRGIGVVVAAVIAVTGMATAGLVQAETPVTSSSATVLTLSATGEVKAVPDLVSLNFGVSTNGDTAEDAIRLNRDQMTSVMASLKAQGVTDTDITTSGISLNARYVVESGVSTTGYTAVNSVTVRYSDVSKAGAGVDAVVKAGVNQIRSLSLGLKNADQYTSEASALAIKNLMAKADLYAKAAGKTVKRLSVLSDGTTISQPTSDYANIIVSGSRIGVPVVPLSGGETGVRVSVSGQFEIQ